MIPARIDRLARRLIEETDEDAQKAMMAGVNIVLSDRDKLALVGALLGYAQGYRAALGLKAIGREAA